MYKKILVAYDGSDNAERVLRRAILIAKEEMSEVKILVVADTASVNARFAMRYLKEFAEDIVRYSNEQLAKAMDVVGKEGVEGVSGLVQEGHPSQVILNLADSMGADLVIVGRRGLSAGERYFLGSVSAAIVAHSSCDVLVVK